jgi:glycosyltransferase involved in cell wall biosynthesis
MLYPVKLIDIELSEPLNSITQLEGYKGIQIMLRLYGRPVGNIKLPVANNSLDSKFLNELILNKHANAILQIGLQNTLAAQNGEFYIKDLLKAKPIPAQANLPLVTVAVCTRNRSEDLARCLEAICNLDYSNLDILIIDNAPGDNSTQMLIENKFPHLRYVREPRPGLNWARNRAIIEARGEIIAYTDDDVIVDKRWVSEMAILFTENPEVMSVTGLVVPYELETKSQALFEYYGGFGRGFQRKWFRVENRKVPWKLLGAGQFGTGANMAYRRCIFDEIGYFDPALDVGTVTNGGGDLEMFFRILKEGHTLVYEPAAFVRHRHRRSYPELRYQITNNSKGFFSYCIRSIRAYPNERDSFYRLWFWWIRKWILRRLIKSYVGESKVLRDLIIAEIQGFFKSFSLYSNAKKTSIKIRQKFEPELEAKPDYSSFNNKQDIVCEETITGIRMIDINKPVEKLTSVSQYKKIRLFIKWDKWLLGYTDIFNHYQPISKSRLIECIAQSHGFKLNNLFHISKSTSGNSISEAIKHLCSVIEKNKIVERISSTVTVSIVVATYDRPDDLRNCLRHLVKQNSSRKIEIIVVDNNPSSGLSVPVISEFPEVILVNETLKGLSYARNAGINASSGDIILTTDDDVTVPPDWVENTVAPFKRDEVMAVTGNVLPIELETDAQHHFEKYGGLGRGFNRFKANKKWFTSFKRKAVPTWKLGACANAAFRASVFEHPHIGLFNEALGAGTPTGCSEDSYLMYKILKANYEIIYEPTSYVWHKHRQTLKAFRKQIYNYSKGHIAHHLLTAIHDKDLRGLYRIFIDLPLTNLRRLKQSIIGRSDYPVSMIFLEIAGNFAGPLSLLRSWLKVKKQGRSASYKGYSKLTGESKNILKASEELIDNRTM